MGCSLPHSAWYRKELPTFVDAVAWVWQRFWQARFLQLSSSDTDVVKIPKALLASYSDLLCYAA
jgi:hypothetical protein